MFKVWKSAAIALLLVGGLSYTAEAQTGRYYGNNYAVQGSVGFGGNQFIGNRGFVNNRRFVNQRSFYSPQYSGFNRGFSSVGFNRGFNSIGFNRGFSNRSFGNRGFVGFQSPRSVGFGSSGRQFGARNFGFRQSGFRSGQFSRNRFGTGRRGY